jgi:hypothetical protein
MRRIPFIAVCAIIMSLGPLFGQGMTFIGLGNVRQPPTTVAPGQIITLLVSNSKTVLPPLSAFQRATTLPLPTTLAGFSVSIPDYTGTHPAAILGIGQSPLCQNPQISPVCLMTALQIQIPFELTYQINVKFPDNLPPIPACTGIAPSPLISYVQMNLTIDIGGIDSLDGAAICVQPGQ